MASLLCYWRGATPTLTSGTRTHTELPVISWERMTPAAHIAYAQIQTTAQIYTHAILAISAHMNTCFNARPRV